MKSLSVHVAVSVQIHIGKQSFKVFRVRFGNKDQ